MQQHPRYTHKLYGQQAVQQSLLDAFNGNNLHHAWLLVGEPGVGKATFAYQAAKFLLSDPQGPKTSIEVASNCESTRKILSRSHPDLFVLEPEEEKTEIKVDHVRELSEFMALTPALGKHKIIIIDSANNLNNNAANALLKLLEEPQDNTFFFLVCHSLVNLLPTIKSRCRQLKFMPLTFTDFYKILSEHKNMNVADAQELYQLTAGSMHYAKLLLLEDALDTYKITEELLLADKREFPTVQKLMTAVSDDDSWKVVKYAIHNTLHKGMLESAKNYTLTERQLDMASKRLHLIQQAETTHIDRSQLIAALFA